MRGEEIIGLGGGDVAFVRGEEGEGVGLDGEAVAAFVLGVPGVALDPGELQGETYRAGMRSVSITLQSWVRNSSSRSSAP